VQEAPLDVYAQEKRLEFAREHRHWTVDDWKQVIFSDETMVTARLLHPHKLVWTKPTRKLNPKLVVPTVQGGGSSIMTWGCISKFGFHDFILLQETLDSSGYIDVLSENLLPLIRNYFGREPCIFQQDGASVHTAHMVTEFLHRHHITCLEWPPHSPDLNIIEHVWHYLKELMRDLPVANSKRELWENIEKVMSAMWSPQMTNKIDRLYESMPSRMQAVIDAHGGNTKY
jgi:hypothetical protein